MPSTLPPGSFGSSGDKAASAPGASAAAFAAPPRGGGRFHGGGSFSGGDSFHGGGSFRGGGLRGGNLGHLGGEYKAKAFTVYSRMRGSKAVTMALAATRGEARQNSRRRRRKDADTGPHTKHGPPGDLLGVLGHAARAAARLFRQLGR
jgi:hypothetical protein